MILKFIRKLVKKDYYNSYDNDSYNRFNERKRLMKFNRFLSKPKVFTGIYLVFAAAVFIIAVLLLNWIQNFSLGSVLQTGDLSSIHQKKESVIETMISHPVFLIVMLVFLAVGYLVFAYRIRVSQGSLNIGQKGTARWTTREELDEQFIKIPEKEIPFPGMGGIPVARSGNHLYIDNTNVNNLIIGGTRSGKGQTTIEPMAEIISRADEKCSMVITDPKMELANKMIPVLNERGYETHILNLIDPEYSMGYNPLALIVQEYKDGNEDSAQQLAASLGYNVFANNEADKDKYFTDQARNVFVAAVMADIKDNIELDREQNKRWQHEHDKKEKERERKYYKRLYGSDYTLYVLKKYVDKILANEGDISDLGILVELQSLAAAGVLNREIAIKDLSESMISNIRNFKYKENNFRKKRFYPSNENEKKINIYSIIKMCNFLVSQPRGQNRTALDEYFDSRPEDDFSRIMYGSVITASENTKGTIMSVFRGGVSIFGYDSIAKMTAESTLDFMDVGFGERPVAVFIALPDYDSSNWFIATVFINQMYFILAKLATAMPGGKLLRRVNFILEEFGNLPALDNFENIITVCLGRNMTFTLAIQALAQVNVKYHESADTITGNCGNWIYIMTNNNDTAEEISRMLGKETITTVNRTGRKLSISKELTEMTDEKPLLTDEELRKLEMGETVVIRPMYRQARGSQKGLSIKAHPIANMGEYRMKYAYTFLNDVFPQKQLLYQSDRLIKMREKVPYLKKMKINIVAGYIEMTSHINLQERSRSGEKYVAFCEYKKQPYVPIVQPASDGRPAERDPKDYSKLKSAIMLLNVPKSEVMLYMEAGKCYEDDDGNSQIQNPEYVLINSSLIEYAYALWGCKSKAIQEKGFQLFDLVLPLGEKPVTKEELYLQDQIEQEILNASRKEVI